MKSHVHLACNINLRIFVDLLKLSPKQPILDVTPKFLQLNSRQLQFSLTSIQHGIAFIFHFNVSTKPSLDIETNSLAYSYTFCISLSKSSSLTSAHNKRSITSSSNLCLCILIVCLCIFIVPAGTLRLPWLRFSRAFSSVVRQIPG